MGMITVKRANVLLTVPDYQQDEYLQKGFDVVDDEDNVLIAATMSTDLGTLQRKLAEAQDKIKELEEEIVRLNKELDEIAEEDSVELEPPKKSSSKKSSK